MIVCALCTKKIQKRRSIIVGKKKQLAQFLALWQSSEQIKIIGKLLLRKLQNCVMRSHTFSSPEPPVPLSRRGLRTRERRPLGPRAQPPAAKRTRRLWGREWFAYCCRQAVRGWGEGRGPFPPPPPPPRH